MGWIQSLLNLLLDALKQYIWQKPVDPPQPIDPTPIDPTPIDSTPIDPPDVVDPTPVDPDNPIPPPSQTGKYDIGLLDEHNQTRMRANKKPLVINELLTKAALNHAIWMATNNSMSHDGENGSGPLDRVRSVGYNPSKVGENIAMGYPDIATVMSGWRKSPGHYSNIIGDYKEVGFGVVSRGNRLFWAAVFATGQAKTPTGASISSDVEIKVSGPLECPRYISEFDAKSQIAEY